MLRVAVITPVYNEQEGLPEFFRRCTSTFSALGPDVELTHILFDDSSTDDSFRLIRDYGQDTSIPYYRYYIYSTPNMKANCAIWRALHYLPHDVDACLLLLPADLQDPPEVLSRMIPLLREGHDAVFGVRQNRHASTSLPMQAFRALYYFLLGVLSDAPVIKHSGAFVLVNRAILDRLLQRPVARPFPYIPTYTARFVTNPATVPFDWQPRHHGRSHYSFLSLVRYALSGLRWCRDWSIR